MKPDASEDMLNKIKKTMTPHQNEQCASQESEKCPNNKKPDYSRPILSGKLASHLSEQEPRHLTPALPFTAKTSQPWQVENAENKAMVALSLIVTCHIVHYAHAIFPEKEIAFLRDSILQSFGVHDAVRLEVEAYDLINWFAGAMNETWQMPTNAQVLPQQPGTDNALIPVLQRAIAQKRDLLMRYYTGSRGEFSERRITPLEVTAEKYLIAFCQLRQEERVFRLSRIIHLEAAEYREEDSTQFVYPLTSTAPTHSISISRSDHAQKKNAKRAKSVTHTSGSKPKFKQLELFSSAEDANTKAPSTKPEIRIPTKQGSLF